MIDQTKTRLKIAAGLFAFFTVDGLLLFGYMYFEELARGNAVPFAEPLIEELTGSYGGAILVAVIMWGTWRFRLTRQNWRARVPVYMLAMVVYSAAHTLMNALSRNLLFPLAGLGQYDYGIMALRFPMEFFNDIVSFWMWVLLLHLFYHYRESRDREVRTAQLESELTRAQLANLRAQLQPHFLFNTLNAISSHMYQDPSRADRMMTELSDLLRKTFTSATQQKVTLSEELEILRLYFDIMKGRFEDRLEVTVHVDRECERALVPSMILQPLAENAIRHGTARHTDVGRIDVSVRRNGGTLELAIADNGPGVDGDLEVVCDRGLGLKNTVERLRRLYGEKHRFKLANGTHGGLTVLVKIPFEVPLGEGHPGVPGGSRAIHE